LISTKEDRVFHWLKSGARPTDTVRSLLRRTGLWMKWSMNKKGLGEAAIAKEMEKWQMGQAEKAQREEARKARRKAKKRARSDQAPAPAPAEVPAPPAQA
jgi:small subunit ribosomal protein S16